jgi:hypothetical protein
VLQKEDFFMVNGVYIELPVQNDGAKKRLMLGHNSVHVLNVDTARIENVMEIA